MVVVTMYRFVGNGVACKSDRQSDRCDKAFDHETPCIIEGCLTTSAQARGVIQWGGVPFLLEAQLSLVSLFERSSSIESLSH
jgi:hypothetical protein